LGARIPVASKRAYLAGLAAEVMSGRHDGTNDLSFGLELLLEGFEPLRTQA
jgi:hypothetical protein